MQHILHTHNVVSIIVNDSDMIMHGALFDSSILCHQTWTTLMFISCRSWTLLDLISDSVRERMNPCYKNL